MIINVYGICVYIYIYENIYTRSSLGGATLRALLLCAMYIHITWPLLSGCDAHSVVAFSYALLTPSLAWC